MYEKAIINDKSSKQFDGKIQNGFKYNLNITNRSCSIKKNKTEEPYKSTFKSKILVVDESNRRFHQRETKAETRKKSGLAFSYERFSPDGDDPARSAEVGGKRVNKSNSELNFNRDLNQIEIFFGSIRQNSR